jgi:alanyl-tRNA synthetase
MDSREIRSRFLKFFAKNGHAIIPSAPLVPENDPSVLFNTAGMQPLVPYLMGQPHPLGKRLTSCQKCVRTGDLDDIGDNRHFSFFEMLGNWSLGDYFKEEAIKWSYEFLTSKEEGLGLDPQRLYVTVFEGDDNAPRDEEAYAVWKKIFEDNNVTGERIYFMGAKSNWWSAGDSGPCGPDTEMFYDTTGTHAKGMTKEEYMAADDRQEVVEIWNDVFMQYEKRDGKVVGKLASHNVDTGSGLERVAMMVQGKTNVFDTDLFTPIMRKIEELASREIRDVRGQRIVADHIRTSIMMIADGVTPSNTDQGYILRRLLRRAVRYADVLGMPAGTLAELFPAVWSIYEGVYDNVGAQREHIISEIQKEEEKFRKTLERGMKEFVRVAKDGVVSAEDAFQLFSTHGFPLEMTEELAREQGATVDRAGFEEAFKKHQELSRAGAEQKFKGGLADTSEMSTKYHTATHMLHQALRTVLGPTAFQKGSNITPERLRFDFAHGEKMTDEQKKAVEDLINQKIAEALPVFYEDITMEEAKNRGAVGLFEDKYGDLVRVYQVGEGDKRFSLELCGGPHVSNTSELGRFKIAKEEAVAQGIRRIKAVLE